jgi:serine phosphatase RsbU (regulator of sigma subunit)
VLRKTNELLCATEMSAAFVTALALIVDAETGKVRMASAGHPGPIYAHPFGAAIVDPPYGPPLGSFWAEYSSTEVFLSSRDALVLYTDGVTEARRGNELFGEERLVATIAATGIESAQGLAEALASSAASFTDLLRDDLQVLVVGHRLAPPDSPGEPS